MYTYEQEIGRIFHLGVVGREAVTLEGRQRKRAEWLSKDSGADLGGFLEKEELLLQKALCT